MKILIADSGSTKTEWAGFDTKSMTPAWIKSTIGLNPLYCMEDEIAATAEELDFAADAVYFYGSGCTPELSGIVCRALGRIFPDAAVEVASDVVGAARALFGREGRGIACIIGTGSVAARVDMRVPSVVPYKSMGYILGDEGSGSTLGKRLLADYCKRAMPPALSRELEAWYPALSAAEIIEHVYRAPRPNRYMASFVPFITRHLDRPYCRRLVNSGFADFFRRNVELILKDAHDAETGRALKENIGCVGSVAYYLRPQLEAVASARGCRVVKVLRTPVEGLVAYHGGNFRADGFPENHRQ